MCGFVFTDRRNTTDEEHVFHLRYAHSYFDVRGGKYTLKSRSVEVNLLTRAQLIAMLL